MCEQLIIVHQYPHKTQVLEHEELNVNASKVIGTDKKIGVRQVGVWSDTDTSRHLFLLMDVKGDNKWKVVSHFIDRGQYTNKVRDVTPGTLKNIPPYRDYPYGEENAKMRIGLVGPITAHSTWCRQINPVISDFKLDMSNGKVKEKVEVVKEKVVGKLLWDSANTLSHEAVRVASGNYANDDVADTILHAYDGGDRTAMFGIRNKDAVWSGTGSMWFVNHHVIDSDVSSSMLEFYMLMGDSTQAINIQLGNRNARGWILEDNYAFGGYTYQITAEGVVRKWVEYYNGTADGRKYVNEKSLSTICNELKGFKPNQEVGLRVSFRSIPDKKSVHGDIDIDLECNGNWTLVSRDMFGRWKVNKDEVLKGRVDSKQIMDGFYGGPFMHWMIARYNKAEVTDNGSLINKIKVFKL